MNTLVLSVSVCYIKMHSMFITMMDKSPVQISNHYTIYINYAGALVCKPIKSTGVICHRICLKCGNLLSNTLNSSTESSIPVLGLNGYMLVWCRSFLSLRTHNFKFFTYLLKNVEILAFAMQKTFHSVVYTLNKLAIRPYYMYNWNTQRGGHIFRPLLSL